MAWIEWANCFDTQKELVGEDDEDEQKDLRTRRRMRWRTVE